MSSCSSNYPVIMSQEPDSREPDGSRPNNGSYLYQSKVATYQKLAPDAFYIFYSFDGAFKRKHGAT
jgi:hypothetical protein